MKKSKLGSLCQAPYEGHEVKVKRQRFRMPREGDELRYEGDAADLVAIERKFLEMCGFVQKPDGSWSIPVELKKRVLKAISLRRLT